jgi:hypothetical protein
MGPTDGNRNREKESSVENTTEKSYEKKIERARNKKRAPSRTRTKLPGTHIPSACCEQALGHFNYSVGGITLQVPGPFLGLTTPSNSSDIGRATLLRKRDGVNYLGRGLIIFPLDIKTRRMISQVPSHTLIPLVLDLRLISSKIRATDVEALDGACSLILIVGDSIPKGMQDAIDEPEEACVDKDSGIHSD